jgi:hypothetical protein
MSIYLLISWNEAEINLTTIPGSNKVGAIDPYAQLSINPKHKEEA